MGMRYLPFISLHVILFTKRGLHGLFLFVNKEPEMFNKLKKALKVPGTLSASIIIASTTFMSVYAAPANPTPNAKVSFTFDEGYDSTRTQAAPTLAKYGFSGTVYVTTGC